MAGRDDVIQFTIEGVDRFSGAFGDLMRKFDGMGKGMGVVTAIAAGVVAGFTKLALEFAETADQLGKLSEKTGIAVETLSGLKYAVELNDASMEDLSTGVRFLSRQMQDFVDRAEVGGSALRALNIDATDAEGKLRPVEDVLFDIADRFAAMPDGAGKAAAAVELFSRGGQSLIPILNQGSEGIRELIEEAGKFGLIITKEMAAKADQLNDDLQRLKTVAQGLGYEIGAQLVPALADGAAGIVRFLKSSKEGGESGVLKAMDTIIRSISHGLVGLAAGFEQLGERLGALAAASTALVSGNWRQIDAIDRDFRQRAEERAKKYEESVKAIWGELPATVKAGAGKSEEEYRNYVEKLKQVTDEIQKKWAGTTKNRLDQVYVERNEMLKALDELKAKSEETARAREQIDEITARSRLDVLRKYYDEAGQYDDLYYQHARANLVEQAAELKQVLGETFNEQAWMNQRLIELERATREERKAARAEELTEQIYQAQTFSDIWTYTLDLLNTQMLTWNEVSSQLITDTFNSVSSGIGQSVANAIIYSENLGDALKNVLKQAAANIIAMLVQVGVQRLILSALSIGANKAQASSEIGTGLAKVYVNSFASAAAIPVYGWALAPNVAAANLGIAMVGTASAGAAGAGVGAAIGGAAHGGLTNVPSEQTYLLDRGERVLSPNQNEDLTEFLDRSSSGGVVIQNLYIDILPNATSFDALMSMSQAQMREIVAGKIIEAMNSLDRMGIRPVSAERMGR